MKKWQDKIHPLVAITESHKQKLKMDAESIDVVLEKPYKDVVVTVKFDGEHSVIQWKKEEPDDCIAGNRFGTLRNDFPPSKELAKIMKLDGKFQEVTFAGELYAVWEDGHKMTLGDVAHHIKAPLNQTEENRIKIALFDIISINNTPVYETYWKKLLLIKDIIKDATFLHVVTAKQGSSDVISDMWKQEVVAKKLEGLVIHTDGLVKVKVVHNMDLVVVGMKKEGKSFERNLAGALLPAFMAPNGTFIVSSNVGTGFSERERKEWFDWIMANTVGEMTIEGTPYVMCKPERILEIGANDWYIYDEPHCEGLKFTANRFEKVGLLPGVKGQKPRFAKDENGNIRERRDKSVNPIDLRLTQAPDFNEEWLSMGATPAPVSVSVPAPVVSLPTAPTPEPLQVVSGSIQESNSAMIAFLFGKTERPPMVAIDSEQINKQNKAVMSRLFAKQNPVIRYDVNVFWQKFHDEIHNWFNATKNTSYTWLEKTDYENAGDYKAWTGIFQGSPFVISGERKTTPVATETFFEFHIAFGEKPLLIHQVGVADRYFAVGEKAGVMHLSVKEFVGSEESDKRDTKIIPGLSKYRATGYINSGNTIADTLIDGKQFVIFHFSSLSSLFEQSRKLAREYITTYIGTGENDVPVTKDNLGWFFPPWRETVEDDARSGLEALFG